MVVRSGLTKKAEPPPTRDVNRDSGTDSANGGWLRRLVRPRLIIQNHARQINHPGLSFFSFRTLKHHCCCRMTAKLARLKDEMVRTITRPKTQTIKITRETGWLDAASLQVGKYDWRLWQVSVVYSGLTKKAEPRGNGDVASQNAQAQNGCAQPRWLRRLVRPHVSFLSSKSQYPLCPSDK